MLFILGLGETGSASGRIQIWPLLSRADSPIDHGLAGRLFPRNRRLKSDHLRHKKSRAALCRAGFGLRTRPFWAVLASQQKVPSSLTSQFVTAVWYSLLSHFRVETAIVGIPSSGGGVQALSSDHGLRAAPIHSRGGAVDLGDIDDWVWKGGTVFVAEICAFRRYNCTLLPVTLFSHSVH